MADFSIFHWLIVLFIFALIFSAGKGLEAAVFRRKGLGSMVCPACGTRGFPQIKTRGSLGIEIVLWLCLIVPGLIYSLWRLTTRYDACPACQQPGMIPVESPRGKKLLSEDA